VPALKRHSFNRTKCNNRNKTYHNVKLSLNQRITPRTPMGNGERAPHILNVETKWRYLALDTRRLASMLNSPSPGQSRGIT